MTNPDHTGEPKVADDLVQLAIWLEGQAVFHETSIARRDPFVIDHIKWLRASSAAVTSLRAQLAAAKARIKDVQGYWAAAETDGVKQAGKLRATEAQLENARKALEAFRNADEQDWRRLFDLLGFSGHGRFWRAVFEEFRPLLRSLKPDGGGK